MEVDREDERNPDMGDSKMHDEAALVHNLETEEELTENTKASSSLKQKYTIASREGKPPLVRQLVDDWAETELDANSIDKLGRNLNLTKS